VLFCLLLIFMVFFFAILSGVFFKTILFIYNLALSFILCGDEKHGFPKFIIFFLLNVAFIYFVLFFLFHCSCFCSQCFIIMSQLLKKYIKKIMLVNCFFKVYVNKHLPNLTTYLMLKFLNQGLHHPHLMLLQHLQFFKNFISVKILWSNDGCNFLMTT
jgi:hypothetical protein